MNATVVDQIAVAETATQADGEPTHAQEKSTADAQLSEFDSLLRAPGLTRSSAPDSEPPAAAGTDSAIESVTSPKGAEEAPQVIEADVDGRRVRVVAKDEIVLQCGDASITLRRNGRIVIKGTYIETCSEGTNRIKGGQVRIN
jgi:hypothetical protein